MYWQRIFFFNFMNRGVVGDLNFSEVCWKYNAVERKQSGSVCQKTIRFILAYSHSIFQFQWYLHLLQRKLFVLQIVRYKKASNLHISSLLYFTHFIRCMSAQWENMVSKSLHVVSTILQLET